jgi:hypothetical protein
MAPGDLLPTQLTVLDDVSAQINKQPSVESDATVVASAYSSDAPTDSDVLYSPNGAPVRSEVYPSLQGQIPTEFTGAVQQILQTDNDNIDVMMAELGSTDSLLMHFT